MPDLDFFPRFWSEDQKWKSQQFYLTLSFTRALILNTSLFLSKINVQTVRPSKQNSQAWVLHTPFIPSTLRAGALKHSPKTVTLVSMSSRLVITSLMFTDVIGFPCRSVAPSDTMMMFNRFPQERAYKAQYLPGQKKPRHLVVNTFLIQVINELNTSYIAT